MAKVRQDGEEYTAQNGYHYRKVNGKWELIHKLIAEERLGRKLLPNEGVYFDDGNRDNLDPDNIKIRIKGKSSVRSRLAVVEERIRELQAEKEMLLKQLEN